MVYLSVGSSRDKADAVTRIKDWLNRMHSIVIGPGLGRQPSVLQTVKELIAHLQQMHLPMVVDAVSCFFTNLP